jgi:EAL domain-containing protein (putative c-di-GMP-specific phosphodiesterase class I)
VKIDRSFVAAIDGDPARQALVAGMVHFTGLIDVDLIAEGVETEREAESLRNLGVPLAQGYLFGRPAAIEDLDVAGRRRGRPH